MDGLAMVLLLAAGVVVAVVVFLRSSASRDVEQVDAPGPVRAMSYHAVEVHSADGGCEAARAVRGKRFLSTEAPLIPLPMCKRSSCSCAYVHYDDRRAHQRRDVYLHKSYEIGERMEEKRARVGRRQSDRLLFGSDL